MPTVLRKPVLVTDQPSCALEPYCAVNVEGCVQVDTTVYATKLSVHATNISAEAASNESQATLNFGEMWSAGDKTGGLGFKWAGDAGTFYGLMALDDESNRTYNRGFVGFEGTTTSGTCDGGTRDFIVSLPNTCDDEAPTERMRITSSGETSVSSGLKVQGSHLRVQTYSGTTGGLWVGTTQSLGMIQGPATVNFESRDSDGPAFALNPMSHYASTHNFYTNTAASMGVWVTQGSNSWQTHSDTRKKANWTRFEGAAARISRLESVGSYTLVDPLTKQPLEPPIRHVGLSAQEVQTILPEAVHTADDGYLSLAYQDVFVLGLKAVKEHEEELRSLRATAAASDKETSRLATENRQLASRVDALEGRIDSMLRAMGHHAPTA